MSEVSITLDDNGRVLACASDAPIEQVRTALVALGTWCSDDNATFTRDDAKVIVEKWVKDLSKAPNLRYEEQD